MYISTRDNYSAVTASRAIKLGMVPDGGLFVPRNIPKLSPEVLLSWQGAAYQEIAHKVLELYLDDFTDNEIDDCVMRAYGSNFYDKSIAPLVKLSERLFVLELWHGPTAAFKDMALQVMPYLLTTALSKEPLKKEIVILVATSGDTGKAALEGFKNVEGIKIIVFYPQGGVSRIQELQMVTTEGSNTSVIAVKGNFDDCQSAVKDIFADKAFKEQLYKQGYELSSANSINWGRLLPQIVYYIYTYLNLVYSGSINNGEKINVVVPTGNFGNILAAWYASRMGIPINKLICASNENKVLTDFFRTGIYDRNRSFKQTSSPSMDILISSNLERFLFEINGHNGKEISQWMEDLKNTGRFEVGTETKRAADDILWGGSATESETYETIRQLFIKTGYTIDTHTAVGLKVWQDYQAETDDSTPAILASTASPFKFNAHVLAAIKGKEFVEGKDEYLLLEELSRIIDYPIHPGLQGLDKKPILHKQVYKKDSIQDAVLEVLGVK